MAASVAVDVTGVDLYVAWASRNAEELAQAISKYNGDGLSLQMIDNRGVKVWPGGSAETFCTDSFRCRFMAEGKTDTDLFFAHAVQEGSAVSGGISSGGKEIIILK